ncbi:MAG: ImuA family protein [Geminicoccaceae bacterium]
MQSDVITGMSIRKKRSVSLAGLRRRIDRIERGHLENQRPASDMRADIDRVHAEQVDEDPKALDPFLARGGEAVPALQELVADDYGSQPAVRDFTLALIALLLRRQTAGRGMVLWCQRQRDALEFGRLYGPGLRDLGLPPDRLLMVSAKRDADCLWAMEQGLASRSLLAVVGLVDHAGLIASRRLSLASSAHRTFCFLLPVHHGREPSAARTRWRINPVPSMPDPLDPKGLGKPSWHLVLERSPGGRTGQWTVEWDHAAHHFHLASNLGVARRHRTNEEASSVIAFDRTG